MERKKRTPEMWMKKKIQQNNDEKHGTNVGRSSVRNAEEKKTNQAHELRHYDECACSFLVGF